MKPFRLCYKFFRHFLSARHTGGFGVHSPFLFHFTRFVLHEKHPFSIFSAIENVRFTLKRDKRAIEMIHSGIGLSKNSTVATIAIHSLQSAKQCQLLFRLAHYFKSRNILELGTSLGITTSYLASSSTNIKCVSLEDCPQIARIAQENFIQLGLSNISIEMGNIDTTLELVLKKAPLLDLVVFNVNGNSEATIPHFMQCLPKVHKDTVLVIDAIYASVDREQAWQIIQNHPQVTATIDLFQFGIVFFNTDLYKKHYKMRY